MIVVVGGTGRLGAHLLSRLAARGEPLRVLSRRPPPPERTAALAGAEHVAGDVRDPGAVARAIAGARVVVSAMHGFGEDRGVDPRSVDLEGNRTLIDAATRAGTEQLVLLSIRDATATHPLELFRMKHAAEALLTQSRLAWTILRPGAFLELWLWFLCERLAASNEARIFGRGDNPINFISVEDVAWMVERAIFDPALRGARIDLGGPDNLSFRELVQRFCRATGATRDIKRVPRALIRTLYPPMRLFNPTVARHMKAAIVMDSADMTYDAAPLQRRFPELPWVTADRAINRDYLDPEKYRARQERW